MSPTEPQAAKGEIAGKVRDIRENRDIILTINVKIEDTVSVFFTFF